MPSPAVLHPFCIALLSGLLLLGWLLLRTARRLRQLRKVREMDLAADKKRVLDAIFSGLGEACLLVSPQGEILYANEGAHEIFNASVTLLGRRLSQLVPDDRITAFVNRALHLKDGSVEDLFVVTVHPRGRREERYLMVNAAPVRDGVQAEPQIRVVMRDETRRQETERIRRDFVTNASHELRTPLAIINGYLENLLEGVITDPAQVTRSLEIMRKHGERLARLVEDMLAISKFESAAEAAAETLRQQTFSCRECVAGVLERLAPLFDQKKARFVVEIPPEDAVAGDQFYWDQVFFNLIENALKENRDDGRLVITVSAERQGQAWEFRIRDNGVGIPHENLPFIFKRFYRVAPGPSRQQVKGTGLGLSIVKRAVEAHGGTIELESTPGLRTEFLIRLPDPSPDAAPGSNAV
ncbi:MAG: PAS domain-containing protein [Verrucomicrobiales bacterium]|nr:PAS domain-containing protein [Verrucomicrobiales bacterium]